MIQVRPAEPRDAAGIRRVLLAAFPTGAEADLVERIETDGDRVISLVATDHGEMMGHVLFSRMATEGDGRAIPSLGLGPVAVDPRAQQAGIGSALIRAGLGIATAYGTELVFVLGEPEYYGRFGFSAETARPFSSPYAGPYLMALPLQGGFTPPATGRADYAQAFTALGDAA
jgi:putative acetyltransferase